MTSAMILPVGMSYAVSSNVTATTSVKTMSNQTSVNQTMAMSLHSSNTTSTNQTATTSTNSTTPQNTSDTKAAQGVSDFIHQAVMDFKQQGTDTRQVMLDCRDKLQTASPSDISKIRQDCSIQLNTIKAKYQDERSHYHDLMKQYRQSVIVFLNDAHGLTVSKAAMDDALAKLGIMMHMAMSTGEMGHVSTMNNTR